MRRIAIACVVVLLAAGAQASQIEEATGVDYQYDGDTHGDASDFCPDPSPVLPVGNETSGILVPLDDPEDDYGLNVRPGDVNEAITVRLTPGPALEWGVETGVPDYDLVVHSPGCGAVLGKSSRNGTSTDTVTFVPSEDGVHTIQVVFGDGGLPGFEPIPMGCHSICAGTFNKVVGYNLTNSG